MWNTFKKKKMCVLDDTRECIECGECDRCDLDPNKICDNCMKCLKMDSTDYRAVEIDDIIMNKSDADGYDDEFDEIFESEEDEDSEEETDNFFN